METPLTLFVWSSSASCRCASPSSASPRRAFDPALNPIRAKVSLGMRVLTRRRPRLRRTSGGSLFMGYLRAQGAARRAVRQRGRSARSASAASHEGHGRARGDASQPFPPTSRYYGIEPTALDAAGRPRRRLPAPALRAAAGALRAAAGARRSRRASGSITSRAATSATRAVLAALRRQRRAAARRADRDRRARACASRCRKAFRGRRDA